MLCSDFGIDNDINLCETCHYKLVACPPKSVVYGTKVVEATGILGICMCTRYDPALVISRAPVYRDVGRKAKDLDLDLDVGRKAKAKDLDLDLDLDTKTPKDKAKDQ